MILRLNDKLAKKIREDNLPSLPARRNRFADWSAHLFTADRTQYILISSTAALYSMVTYGAGVTDDNRLIHVVIDTMRDVMKEDGLELIYKRRVAPELGSFQFAKTLTGATADAISELILAAKHHLTSGEISPYDVSFILNDVPLSHLKGQHPLEAFQKIGR